MPEKKNKGLFDFASEHPFITLFVVCDLFTTISNVVGHICGRGKPGVIEAGDYVLTKQGADNLDKLIAMHGLDEPEETEKLPEPEEEVHVDHDAPVQAEA